MPTPDLGVRYCAVTEQSKPHWSWANFAFTGGRQALRAFKQRWRGPARVVMRESDHESGKPLCYWIVHGTPLIRVAPEHVRPSVEDDGKDLADNVAAAHEAVQGFGGRSTTQYVDLRGTAGPTLDSDSDEDMGVWGRTSVFSHDCAPSPTPSNITRFYTTHTTHPATERTA